MERNGEELQCPMIGECITIFVTKKGGSRLLENPVFLRKGPPCRFNNPSATINSIDKKIKKN
jgi:hypothetical protein